MNTRLALMIVSLAAAPCAGAQPIGMDQVAGKSARLSVEQISPTAQERSPSAPAAIAPPRVAAGDPPLASRLQRKDSIDPEEIARVLGAGQANTIDAAAALASGAVAIDASTAPAAAPSDTDKEQSARAPVEPRER